MLLYTTLPTILIQQFDLAFKEYETSTRLVGAVIPFVKKIAIQPRVATPSYFFLLLVISSYFLWYIEIYQIYYIHLIWMNQIQLVDWIQLIIIHKHIIHYSEAAKVIQTANFEDRLILIFMSSLGLELMKNARSPKIWAP